MALIIKGKSYPMPGQDGQQNLTGDEIIAIEDHFGLDGLDLMAVFNGAKAPKGYTKAKALWAVAWVGMSRAGEVVSIADVLRDVAVDEIVITDEPANPTEAA